MSKVSRRLFLKHASAGIAAAAGAVALAPRAGAAGNSLTALPPRSAHGIAVVGATVANSEPIVAYVREAGAEEVSLFIGAREVRVHDTELARRIAIAAASV